MGEKFRYAAKLMFQFRVVVDGQSNKRRTVEERIVLFDGLSADDALNKANIRGEIEEYSYENDDGNEVFFEFVGVIDLMHLGIENKTDEVWYEISQKLTPFEKKETYVPEKFSLSAFKYEKNITNKGVQ